MTKVTIMYLSGCNFVHHLTTLYEVHKFVGLNEMRKRLCRL